MFIDSTGAYFFPSTHRGVNTSMQSPEGHSSSPLEGNLQPSGKLSDGRDDEPIASIQDDSLYCLHSAFVFFQVERSLFCIPTYRFVNNSDAFTKLFKLPEPNERGVKGSSREEPIILPNITRGDFHNFMKILYPLAVATHLKLSKLEWISVLRLSTLWYFLEYRKMAISNLEDSKELSSTDKIVYGREFKIRSWIEEGCAELVSRRETIDRDEASAVGFEMTFSLFRIREERIQGNLGFGITTTIRQALRDELDLVGRCELEYRTDPDNSEVDMDLKDDIQKENPIPFTVNAFGSAFGPQPPNPKENPLHFDASFGSAFGTQPDNPKESSVPFGSAFGIQPEESSVPFGSAFGIQPEESSDPFGSAFGIQPEESSDPFGSAFGTQPSQGSRKWRGRGRGRGRKMF